MDVTSGGDHRNLQPVRAIVRFTTEDGRTLQATGSASTTVRPRLGKHITVVYDTADPELLDDMVLVVDEFAGNGIRHTASGRDGKIHIALWAGRDVLRTEVGDEGAIGTRPVLCEAPDGECGRGLHIVDALASRWGHRPDGPGTVVWAEFRT